MFHTHPTTTAILKESKRIRYSPEFQHVAHFANGFVVSDKIRLLWTGDVSTEPTLPNALNLTYPSIKKIIPITFQYELSFKIGKQDKKVLKAFLALAKLNTINATVKLQISKDNILFEITNSTQGNTDNISGSFTLETSNSNITEDIHCKINYEYLLDFLLAFESDDFKMKLNVKENFVLPIVFECSDYSYLLSCLR